MNLEKQVEYITFTVALLCDRIYQKIYPLADQCYESMGKSFTLKDPVLSQEEFDEHAVAQSGFRVGFKEEFTDDGIEKGKEGVLLAKEILEEGIEIRMPVERIIQGINRFTKLIRE
mgnify:CR=1 FL=1